MKSNCQAEHGQATLRQLRKCLRLCLQFPLISQHHPKALNPAGFLLYFDNWDFPGTPFPICLCGLHPFRQCFGCSMCDLSPLGCIITFYWTECKIEAKTYSLCNMSHFFRSCYSAEPMLKHFQQPINFWCQLLVPNSVLIFTRIWNKLELNWIRSQDCKATEENVQHTRFSKSYKRGWVELACLRKCYEASLFQMCFSIKGTFCRVPVFLVMPHQHYHISQQTLYFLSWILFQGEKSTKKEPRGYCAWFYFKHTDLHA